MNPMTPSRHGRIVGALFIDLTNLTQFLHDVLSERSACVHDEV